jgi:death-on-curing protein
MIELARFLLTAEAVLGIDAERLKAVTQIGSAESALAAPFATFGGHDFYEHTVQRAGVLASRVIRNHPLPDGNKRVAFLLMVEYLEDHGWQLMAGPEEIDRMFRAVAARRHGEDYFIVWLCSRTKRMCSKETRGSNE